MTALKRSLLLSVGILAIVFELGCATGSPPPVVKPLHVSSTALPVAVINAPYSATLAATGGVQPYSWSLASGTLPPGLSIAASGVISGTPTATGSTTFKVQVTDSQSPAPAVDALNKTVQVNKPLSFPTQTVPQGSVGVAYTATLTASAGAPPYTFSVTAGTLPQGLSLSTAGLISGTPRAQETQTFTVQVTDSEATPVSLSQSVTLTINGPNGRVTGNYVFSFSGFQNGAPVYQAGSFTGDGQGNITAGLMDSNSSNGVLTQLAFTGSYSLNTNNTGTMTLNIQSLGTFTYQVAAPAVGTIRFIQNGTAGNQGSGTIHKVTSSAKITLAQLAAYWAFGATGRDASNNRYAAAGTFQSDNTGAWTGFEQDTNDNGNFSHDTSSTGAFLQISSTTQRGTAVLNSGSNAAHYSFYPVSTSELIMLSTDPVSGTSPLALFSLITRPLNNYTNASIKTSTITSLQGTRTSNGLNVPYALLGLAAFDGIGAMAGTVDENTGGTMSSTSYPGIYQIASNGRTVVTSFTNIPIVFYLGGSEAFIVAGDSGVTAGTILPQFGSSFTVASINGAYLGATVQPLLPTMTVENDAGTADGAGNLSLTYDTSGPGGPQQGLTQSLTYTVDSTTSRAPLVTGGNTVGIAYIVTSTVGTSGSGRIMVLSTDAGARINSLEK